MQNYARSKCKLCRGRGGSVIIGVFCAEKFDFWARLDRIHPANLTVLIIWQKEKVSIAHGIAAYAAETMIFLITTREKTKEL